MTKTEKKTKKQLVLNENQLINKLKLLKSCEKNNYASKLSKNSS